MTGQDKPSEHSQTFEANNETSEVPALTLADYVAFCKQGDAQLLACCEVETFHATGPGGQGVNTADSAVRMRHTPTGIVVVARSERSQLLNRQTCLAKLRA